MGTQSQTFFHFQHIPKLAMWSTCGRAAGRSYGYYDGVVCLGQGAVKGDGKVRLGLSVCLCVCLSVCL